MSRMQKPGYFCGGNATIYLNGVAVDEGVSIEYGLLQNKQPLYGWNCPEYSAIADGQILVSGRLMVNYVSHEYLLAVIRQATDMKHILRGLNPNNQTFNDVVDSFDYQGFAFDELNPSTLTAEGKSVMKEKYWGLASTNASQQQFNTNLKNHFGRPDQHNATFDIVVKYGNEDSMYFTQHLIKHVSFKGRSMGTVITEDPQVEVFDFIARTII